MTETPALPTRCLVDTDVWSDALHLEFRDSGLQLLWWGNEWILVSRKQNWFPRVPPESHQRKREDMLALPALADLFTAGRLIPVVTDAIDIELDTQPHSQTHDFFGFHFGDAETVDIGLRNAAFAQTIDELRRPAKADAEKVLGAITDSRFADLLKLLGHPHLWDVLHIWTAEHFEIPMFISMDRRFRNQFEQTRKRHQSPVRITSPSETIQEFGAPSADWPKVLALRDIFRQQRLKPMCQFHWPRSWRRRLGLAIGRKIKFLPYRGRLDIPDARELTSALVQLELGISRQ